MKVQRCGGPAGASAHAERISAILCRGRRRRRGQGAPAAHPANTCRIRDASVTESFSRVKMDLTKRCARGNSRENRRPSRFRAGGAARGDVGLTRPAEFLNCLISQSLCSDICPEDRRQVCAVPEPPFVPVTLTETIFSECIGTSRVLSELVHFVLSLLAL